MAIEEGQGSRNPNAGVTGYDLFAFPQFYFALSLFVSVALSCRFISCIISISVIVSQDICCMFLLCLSSTYMPLFYSSIISLVSAFLYPYICLSVSIAISCCYRELYTMPCFDV